MAAAIRFRLPCFARGPEEDAREGLRAFAALHKELIVASSYPKNFGLYNERRRLHRGCRRCGNRDRAFSQMKSAIRANYPTHQRTASIVATNPE